jgi:protein Mpv17
LDRFALRYVPAGWKFIATKVSADCLGFAPFHLLAYLTYMGLAEGQSWPVVKENVKNDFLPGLAVDLSVWPVIQSANFAFTPQRHHLMVVNLFGLIDCTFLSWFKHQGEAEWKRKINEFILGPYKRPTTPNG